ncbi:MAG: carbamoyl-phosphate synthase large subunit, partial [Hydrogenophaga sp.]|nr:carbamoyl-phosphate synthase large subunit [Hydrogenophaga sp.]
DCSVQRRHQKIIEESPSPAVSPALRAELGRCAVALAQAAGYVGAGTVEFLLEEGRGESPHPNPLPEGEGASHFYLMEMNTRLQVEHPVTEMITGLDLVEWQLRVARGEALPLTQDQVCFSGHAIEVRLCAEDEHHTPHTGRVRHFTEPDLAVPGLRFDHALETGSTVTPHYDALLGKLIAHAPTRAEAIRRLAHALGATQVLGLHTNRAFLSACLWHPVFAAGAASIPFLAEHGDALRTSLQTTPAAEGVAALALLYVSQPPAVALPSPHPRHLRLRLGSKVQEWLVQETGQGRVRVIQGDRVHEAQISGQRIVLDGVGWSARAVPVDPGAGVPRWHVQLTGGDLPAGTATELWIDDLGFAPREAAGGASAARELRAPFNGKLIALHVQTGQTVARGAPLLVIESMKLEHTLHAPRDTVIESLNVAPGQQVAPGQLLATFL